MTTSLAAINAASTEHAAQLLHGLYEHSPWIVEQALAQWPFTSVVQMQQAMVQVVSQAAPEAQINLIRAHPELAGIAMVSQTLTAESSHEQNSAGLTHCSPQELAQIQQLNADYNARFGFPFILAVRGPRGTGLSRQQIMSTWQRRLLNPVDFEQAEALRNIHRIAEIRLLDKLGMTPHQGNQVWDWAQALAMHSDPEYKEQGQLTVTYLTDAHQAVAKQLRAWMQDGGFDDVRIDAVGNVVGVYHGTHHGSDHGTGKDTKRLLTGSHYDTVRNGGKYDGRLGILVPMAVVAELSRQGRRLPFGIEVVGFAEEEGQRYKATFLGSGALTGNFNPAWLDQQDADGVRMQDAMRAACLAGTLQAIAAEKRDPARYLGFVEVHIEQGRVLNERALPLGVVTSINGSLRYVGEVLGVSCHAGTTPMDRRRDAACAVAELALFVEKRAAAVPDVVGTVGMLQVPAGSINVVPGRCQFSLDLRAATDAARDALDADVCAALASNCERRGLAYTLECTNRVSAAPSHPAWQSRWEAAVHALGVPVHCMPSGAGHDAMKLHEVMPQAMLFMRGMNSGISHNPLESITADDTELCVRAFEQLLEKLATNHR